MIIQLMALIDDIYSFIQYMILSTYDIIYIHDIIYIYMYMYNIYILHWISQPSFMTPEGHRRVRHVAVIAPVRRRHLLQRDLCGQLQLLGTAAGLMGKMWENMGSLP